MSDPNASTHHFKSHLVWVGADQGPTTRQNTYSRRFQIDIEGKPSIVGSASPAFMGDASLPNPEDMLVAALSSCHFLSYAAFCAKSGIQVISYEDEVTGKMEHVNGVTKFTEVVLHPRVVVAPGTDEEKARSLHGRAHGACFIANSVNFPVKNEPTIVIAQDHGSGRGSPG